MEENNIEILLFLLMSLLLAVLFVGSIHVGSRVAKELRATLRSFQEGLDDVTRAQAAISKSVAAINDGLKWLDYRNSKQSIDLYRQIYTAKDIEDLVGSGHVRNLRGWALSPDALLVILKYVSIYKPKLILELGSGYSTVILANFIKKNNIHTKIISVDHSSQYFEQTENLLHSDVAELVKAPLVEYKQGYSWYDSKVIRKAVKASGVKVDLIIVDGPPGTTNPFARGPVLEQLSACLMDHYTIMLDDASRSDEKKVVEDWLDVDNKLSHKYMHTEKGLSILSTKDINSNTLL